MLVRASEERFTGAARDRIAAVVAELRGRELEARGSAVVGAVARPLPPLASGKPWTRDEKEATLAAWLALAGASGPA